VSKRRARRNPGTVVIGDTNDATGVYQRVDTKYTVAIVNPDGKCESTVHCRSIEQCREVARVEAAIQGPFALFVISVKGTPVETLGVSESGQLRSRKHRKQA